MTVLRGLKMRRWTAATWVTMTIIAVFFLAAYAGPGWVFTRQGLGHSSYGLWQKCDRWSVLSTCRNIVNKLDGDPDWLNATRALMSLTGIALIIAIVIFALTFCIRSTVRWTMLVIQALLLFAACLLSLAAVIVYGVEHEYQYSILAYGFYFSCVTCVGCFLSGIWSILDIRDDDSYGY